MNRDEYLADIRKIVYKNYKDPKVVGAQLEALAPSIIMHYKQDGSEMYLIDVLINKTRYTIKSLLMYESNLYGYRARVTGATAVPLKTIEDMIGSIKPLQQYIRLQSANLTTVHTGKVAAYLLNKMMDIVAPVPGCTVETSFSRIEGTDFSQRVSFIIGIYREHAARSDEVLNVRFGYRQTDNGKKKPWLWVSHANKDPYRSLYAELTADTWDVYASKVHDILVCLESSSTRKYILDMYEAQTKAAQAITNTNLLTAWAPTFTPGNFYAGLMELYLNGKMKNELDYFKIVGNSL